MTEKYKQVAEGAGLFLLGVGTRNEIGRIGNIS